MTAGSHPTDEPYEAGICDACGQAVVWSSPHCERCGAALDPAALVPVFVTANAQLLPLLRSALDAAGVSHVVQGEAALALFPLGPLATGLTRNLVAATIHVPRAEAAAAVDVLRGRPESDDEDAEP